MKFGYKEKWKKKEKSLPSWECGLKSSGTTCECIKQIVAPFVGVWIEILGYAGLYECVKVAPFVGVWIEIKLNCWTFKNNKSLPSWECGLKLVKKNSISRK